MTRRTASRHAAKHHSQQVPTIATGREENGDMIDRAIHFTIGYIVAFGGLTLLLPLIGKVAGALAN